MGSEMCIRDRYCVRRRRGAVGGGVPAAGLRVRPRCAILTYVFTCRARSWANAARLRAASPAGRPPARAGCGRRHHLCEEVVGRLELWVELYATVVVEFGGMTHAPGSASVPHIHPQGHGSVSQRSPTHGSVAAQIEAPLAAATSAGSSRFSRRIVNATREARRPQQAGRCANFSSEAPFSRTSRRRSWRL